MHDANPIMKITDMYHSKYVDLGTVLKTFCCTPQSTSPAVMEDSTYTLKMDYFTTKLVRSLQFKYSPMSLPSCPRSTLPT